MMYHKAITFEDHDIAAKIVKESNPGRQKALGRKVENFDNDLWDKVKEKLVEEGNYWKFTQDKERSAWMRTALLETGDRQLVEVGSWSNPTIPHL